MVGIQIGKEQEERKREEEGLNFETTPWWNFITIMGYADEELRSASLLKLRAQLTAKAKAKAMIQSPAVHGRAFLLISMISYEGGL